MHCAPKQSPVRSDAGRAVETARGGIIKYGGGFDTCDVAVVINVPDVAECLVSAGEQPTAVIVEPEQFAAIQGESAEGSAGELVKMLRGLPPDDLFAILQTMIDAKRE
jgi:hypothetical protein